MKYKNYTVIVKFSSGSQEKYKFISATSKKHAEIRMYYFLWQKGYMSEDIKSIKATQD